MELNKNNCLEGYEEVVRIVLAEADKKEIIHYYDEDEKYLYAISHVSIYLQSPIESLCKEATLGRWIIKPKK